MAFEKLENRALYQHYTSTQSDMVQTKENYSPNDYMEIL